MESVKNQENEKQDYLESKIIKRINDKKITTKNNTFLDNVQNETSKIFLYMEEKIKRFPAIFEKNSLSDTIKYLESIAIPYNCECAEIIDNMPSWRCEDCTDFDQAIYCSKCFIKSKQIHKGHKIYLSDMEGMCDCGNPYALKQFCPDHKGPFTELKQIEEYIEKSFPSELLSKLKLFLDDLFLHFSKYLILTEQCAFFCVEILENNFNNKEKEDILLLKENFCIVFQNFLNFLYFITSKNIGMVYLISQYILKNHFSSDKLEENDKISHSCIKLENKKIQILYENKNNKNNNIGFFSFDNKDAQEKHKCECPFLRLLLSNWRDDISSEDNENEKFLISFVHNLFFKEYYTLIYYFLYKEMTLNENFDLFNCLGQFLNQDNAILIEKQAGLISNEYKIFYEYTKEIINNPKSKDKYGGFLDKIIEKLGNKFRSVMLEYSYFTMEKIRDIVCSKSDYIKRFIDVICIIHNQLEFKSIVPHPQFISKKFLFEFLDIEIFTIEMVNYLNYSLDYNNNNKIKDIFDYYLKKILNQKSEKIKQLEKNEFSFHLPLYRCFGLFLNSFSLNYALYNKKSISDSIEYIKTKLFKSKMEMQEAIDLIIYDYLKMFGFILGCRNEFFNYYDSLNNYNLFYFTDKKIIRADFILLKYIFAMTDKKINLDYILKSSNIENVYDLFMSIFKSEDSNDAEKKNIENKGWFNFKTIFNNILNKNKKDNDDKDDNKIILQWTRLFELIISIIRNDSFLFWGLLTTYNKIFISKSKSVLFNNIIKNDIIMKDLRNILKEEIIHIVISNSNLVEISKIKENIDEYFFKLFSDKELNEILDELTTKKVENDCKIYSLKDSCLKYFDMNYYYSAFSKSKAELYLIDFKKNKYKLFNDYYFKPSVLTFDFYNKIYENVLLNIENIELFSKIIEIIFSTKEKESNLHDKLKKGFLPIILNFLTMFGSINSKSFIKFKLENKNIIIR